MSASSGRSPPEGFVSLSVRGGYAETMGPFFHRPDAGELTIHAFHVEARHLNRFGVLHGGVLSAFLDSLMGREVERAADRSGLTQGLTVRFEEMVRQGAWLIGEGRVTSLSDELAEVAAIARVGARQVGHARGAFRLMRRKL